MKRFSALRTALLAIALTLTGCIVTPPASEVGWVTLFDGSNLNNFTRIGDANWRLVDGLAQADVGSKTASYLVTKESYGDFQLRAEFWVDATANSGIFIRMSDPEKVTALNSYEINIFDNSPNAGYGTGGVPNFARALVPMKAGGQWNTYEITAKGSQISALLNGTKVIDFQDSKFGKGPFALQWGTGVVKFRKIQIRPI